MTIKSQVSDLSLKIEDVTGHKSTITVRVYGGTVIDVDPYEFLREVKEAFKDFDDVEITIPNPMPTEPGLYVSAHHKDKLSKGAMLFHLNEEGEWRSDSSHGSWTAEAAHEQWGLLPLRVAE